MVSGVVCWVKGDDPQTTVLTNAGFTGCRMRVESAGKTSLVGAEETYQQVAVGTQWLIFFSSYFLGQIIRFLLQIVRFCQKIKIVPLLSVWH